MSKQKELGSTALVPFKERFTALAMSTNVGALMRANLGSEDMAATDILDRIKVPAGGATFWSVPTLDGEQPMQALEGIIIYTDRKRAYWKSKGVTGTPPDCSSADCETGTGDPGGSCVGIQKDGGGWEVPPCPFNQFGSGINSRGEASKGKACKEVRRLFFLMPGFDMPFIIHAPPASLKNVRLYLGKELPMNRHCHFSQAVTKLSLNKVKSAGGDDYAQINPAFVEKLGDEDWASLRKFGESLQAIFSATELRPEDLNE